MIVSMIVAVAKNGVVGRDNTLPWHLSEDLKYFKRVTMGKPIVMGRLTYESIGRPLPGRTNIVISRQSDYEPPGVQVVSSVESALELARDIAAKDGVDELVVIGGALVYAAALPLAERLYVTEVHAEVEGDAYFPTLEKSQWLEQQREFHVAVEPNPYDYSFVVLQRA